MRFVRRLQYLCLLCTVVRLWLPLTVTLKVRDDQGNVSAEAINDGARVFPQGVCGY